MLRRLGIRGKVLAALSVPVLVLFLLAGYVSLGAVQEAQTARAVSALLTSLQHSRDVAAALQAERRVAAPIGSGQAVDPTEKAESRAATDEAVDKMNRSLNEVDISVLDPRVSAAVRDLRSSLEGVVGVRGRVDANVPLGSIVNNYTRIINGVIAYPSNVAAELDDRPLAAIITAHTAVMTLTERYHEEQVVGSVALNSDREPERFRELVNLMPQSDVQHQQASAIVRALGFDGFTVPPLGASFVNPNDGGDGTSFAGFRTLVATADKNNFGSVTDVAWTRSASLEIAALDDLKSRLRIEANNRAGEVANAALQTSIITIGAAVAAVLLSIITALAIARQIVRPLRSLTEAAATVRDELPRLVDQVAIPGQGPDLTLTRIPVTSRDEIGQLAAAFNEVNDTTIQVAQEQAALRGSIAEMFVNVARRDQILLNRQLSFIDALERSEEDPKTLADLFRLDHLATRMRRNAESLLVLAGIDTGRRLRETLPLSDVVRTASSEIEHYERVQLDLAVDPMMLGHTALPAAHMMAELLENATVFSEPGTPVQVSTGVDADSVIITILDQGLGMTEFELEEANAKIRATSAGDVLGSQRLGMFVVGRIATKLGASVELGVGPGGTGTLATIRMPQVLFVDANTLPMTPPLQAGATVQTFVLPEEAAEQVHDTAFAPAPEHVEDVAAGALGSLENPVEEVDLKALTDGTTGHGLPRRRSRGADVDAPAPSLSHREQDDAAAAPSIPLAPDAAALAGAASASGAGEAWRPPIIDASAPLTVRRPADQAESGTGDLPARQPAAASNGTAPRTMEPTTSTNGLPTRTPGLPSRQPAAPVAGSTASSEKAAPVNPEGRSAMFAGFRSRRAELAAAAVHVESGEARTDDDDAGDLDAAERLAAAAATGSFFGRRPEPQVPLVIPALVDDDDDDTGYPAETALVEVAPEVPQAPSAPAEPYRPVIAETDSSGVVEASTQADLAVEDSVEDAVAEMSSGDVAPWTYPGAEPGAVANTPAEQVADATTTAEQGGDATDETPPRRRGRHALPVREEELPQWAAPPAAEAASEPFVLVTWEGQVQDASPYQAEPAHAETQAGDGADGTAHPAAGSTGAEETSPWAASAEPVALDAEPEPWAQDAEPEPVALDAEPEPWAQDEPAASWPPPAVQLPEPAGVGQLPPDPVGAPPAAPAFSDLVGGTSKPAKKRRWFGRKKAAEPEPVEERPAAFTSLEPMVAHGFPSVAPVRQSAWSTSDAGAHALPGQDEPPVETAAPEIPAAAFAPPAFEAPVFTPAPEVPVAQPAAAAAATWQAPEPPAQSWSAPAPPAVPAWQAAPSAPVAEDQTEQEVWTPTIGWTAPEPSAQAPLISRTPTASAPAEPAAFTPQTTFTPQPTTGGAFDDEVTNMLAQRADLAQQALSELSQLSSYRPKAAPAAEASTLVRRTPGSIPAAPAIEVRPAGQRTERDANQVRSLLSSFQSGTARGREASDGARAEANQNPGGAIPAGNEDGSEVAHGEPVTTPDTDLTQRSTSW